MRRLGSVNKSAPIGVFDSGIGGLTVVKELRALMPQEEIIYFGDTARTPYGSRSPAEIIDFMHQILRFFAAQQVKMAVVACNTMTALGLDMAKKKYPFLLVGVNTGIRSALKVSRTKNIGVIATQATVASGKHGKAAKAIEPKATVYPQACPKFVPLIEGEKVSGAEIQEAAIEYLVSLKAAKVDALVLGCTHYPFISSLISDILGSEVTLIDPARETAEDARALLAKHQLLAEEGPGNTRFCFSADIDRAKRMAQHLFEQRLPDFERVNLQDYQ